MPELGEAAIDGRRRVVVVATAIGGASGGAAMAAAAATASTGGAGLLVELTAATRGPTLFASAAARGLEDALRAAGPGLEKAAARGGLCRLALAPDEESLDRLADALEAGLPCRLVVLHLPPSLWLAALDHPRLAAGAGLLRAELPRDRSIAALAVRDLRDRGLRVRVAGRPLGRIAARRALAGIAAEGVAGRRIQRIVRGLEA